MKHINTLCGQNVELFNATAGGIYSNHCTLKSWLLLKSLIIALFHFFKIYRSCVSSRCM